MAIARAIGDTSPGIDLDEMLHRIEALAKEASELRNQINELNAKVAALSDQSVKGPAQTALAEVQIAVDEGRLTGAGRELAKLPFLRGSQVWIIAVKARANILKLEQDYDGATALLLKAAQEVAAAPPHVRFEFLLDAASAQREKGDFRGDNDALRKAIAIYLEQLLPAAPHDSAPLDWASAQNDLGVALESLGEREADTARLEEAVAAYREALVDRARERVPLDWAMTQQNLGSALNDLAFREAGTARLEEAVGAFREALKKYTRERAPHEWATTQNNLGTALSDLGEREAGTARLEEAVRVYREAFEEFPRERVSPRLGHELTSISGMRFGASESVRLALPTLKRRSGSIAKR